MGMIVEQKIMESAMLEWAASIVSAKMKTVSLSFARLGESWPQLPNENCTLHQEYIRASAAIENQQKFQNSTPTVGIGRYY